MVDGPNPDQKWRRDRKEQSRGLRDRGLISLGTRKASDPEVRRACEEHHEQMVGGRRASRGVGRARGAGAEASLQPCSAARLGAKEPDLQCGVGRRRCPVTGAVELSRHPPTSPLTIRVDDLQTTMKYNCNHEV